MGDLLSIVLPVFLVVGFGYVAVWRGLFSDSAVEGLMIFTQGFAIPCLLFSAIATLDLGQNFDWALLVSFYAGSVTCFVLGLLGARLLFGRPWEDSVAIGFACLFANTVLLGNTLRPLTDKLKISREKLAYMVDSTAAPVAGLALVSTWVAAEIDFVKSLIDAAFVEHFRHQVQHTRRYAAGQDQDIVL